MEESVHIGEDGKRYCYHLISVTRVSPILFTSAGMTDENSVMLFGNCVRKEVPDDLKIDPIEDIKLVTLDFKDVVQLSLGTDRKIAAKAWMVLYMYAQLGRLV